jgi:hypothetical protein
MAATEMKAMTEVAAAHPCLDAGLHVIGKAAITAALFRGSSPTLREQCHYNALPIARMVQQVALLANAVDATRRNA